MHKRLCAKCGKPAGYEVEFTYLSSCHCCPDRDDLIDLCYDHARTEVAGETGTLRFSYPRVYRGGKRVYRIGRVRVPD
jgi:hypothetical protein